MVEQQKCNGAIERPQQICPPYFRKLALSENGNDDVRIEMKIAICLFLMLCCGCASTSVTARPPLSLEHPIVTPPEFQWGRKQPAFAGNSPAARYVSGYERGWWSMLSRYAKDIDYEFEWGHVTSSGHGSGIGGYMDGALAGSARATTLIEHYGPTKTHRLISETFGLELNEY